MAASHPIAEFTHPTAEEQTVTHYQNRGGELTMTAYEVFPGIRLLYQDVRLRRCGHIGNTGSNILEINHCSHGRLEYSVDEAFCYLTPGDLSVSRHSLLDGHLFFSCGYYQGVTLQIDMEKTPRCLSCFLQDVPVEPAVLIEKFCQKKEDIFIARSNDHLEHIFSELYSIPEEVKKGYLKIKVLEILLFLSCMSVSEQEERPVCTAGQVELAKRICRFLTAHMDERITIDDLSGLFHTSPTQIKTCFKSVYGSSVYSFIRTQKMQSAAVMLADGDKTILEISNLHGYDNGSKFAKAFCDVFGTTPNDYRKHHWKSDI